MPLLRRVVAVIVVFVCVTTAFSGCQTSSKCSSTEFLLNTVCEITLYEGGDDALIEQAFSLCKEYEEKFSRTIETSEISQINQSQGMPVTVSPETAKLIDFALQYSALTDGAFDITIGSVSSLWDFSSDTPSVPDGQTVAQALQTVDYRNVVVEGNTVTVPAGTQLDLGAVAKGYIADRCVEFLKENGVTRGIVNLGGNVCVIGEKAENTPWNVGIQRPFAEHTEIIGSVHVSDCSVVTSGIYERCFEQDGVLYHHILDPKTGFPAQTDLESVTILAASSAQADALSTASFLLGSEKAMDLIEQTEGAECILIQTDGTVLLSSGIEQEGLFTPSSVTS